MKYCTSRSCFSAASLVLNVPKFLRFPVFASFFREYNRYSPDFNFLIINASSKGEARSIPLHHLCDNRHMSILEIEDAIKKLPADEVNELMNWLAEYHSEIWDEQIASDLDSGRLDPILSEAEADVAAGKAKPI